MACARDKSNSLNRYKVSIVTCAHVVKVVLRRKCFLKSYNKVSAVIIIILLH